MEWPWSHMGALTRERSRTPFALPVRRLTITLWVRFGRRWEGHEKRPDSRRRHRDGDGESAWQGPRGVLARAHRGPQPRPHGRVVPDRPPRDEVRLRDPEFRPAEIHGTQGGPAHGALLANRGRRVRDGHRRRRPRRRPGRQ